MWEEDNIETTPNKKETSFSFTSMFSKLSPFSQSTRELKTPQTPSNANNTTSTTITNTPNHNTSFWKTPKKSTVPGTIVQTTSNRPTSPINVHASTTPSHNNKKNLHRMKSMEVFSTLRDENSENNSDGNHEEIIFNNNKRFSISNFEQPKVSINVLDNGTQKDSRTIKLEEFLQAPYIETSKFSKLTWNGVPSKLRPVIWRILIGYTPSNRERRNTTLEMKRKEYVEFLQQYWFIKDSERSEYEISLYKQISIDVPRTNPTIKLFQQDAVQVSLNKILYIWAIRHPASGYVQGINDLATPFFVVFITSYCEKWEDCKFESLTENQIMEIEADTFWCLSKLLDNVQDNYTVAQPGIHRMVQKMSELVKTIDLPLYEHLEKENVLFIQFTFRWMNCLLMREFPLHLIVRMWDTYLSESDRFANFHIYVCVAFLVHWSEQLRQLDFQQIMLFIQNIPTNNWDERQMEILLSQSYMYQSLYQNFKKK
eukprot:TRINITY_DN572_c0_g1_i1.p1 TRINITY_DN572_c0_g1~~TRINITY_DN572_c0_g1_i1.p1  ORF type:complete len:484 (+),score=108.88 TRINITY_DN572_c0_g1_i1:31-1482(+)